MKEFLYALGLVVTLMIGALVENKLIYSRITCAQAVLHNNIVKCAVYIDKDVMR